MNRLRLFSNDEDRERRNREMAIKRERQIGTVLMLGIFATFPIVVLACNDDTSSVVERASTPPSVTAEQPRPQPAVVETPKPVEVEEVSLVPDNPTFEDGEIAFREGRYDDAFEIFTVWTEENSDTPWGHYMKGLSALRASRLVEAEDGFGEALAQDPRHVKSLRNVTRLYLQTDRVEEAFGDIQFAIEIEPESGESYRLLAITQDRLGLLEDAIESYQHALTLDPEDAWSMNNLGLIHIQRQEFDKAVAPLARATQLREDVPVFYNNLGVALERTGYEGDAAQSFRRAIELDPDYERAEVSLARVESRDSVDVFVADLEQFARSFVDEIESWNQPSVSSTVDMVPVGDGSVTEAQDTTITDDSDAGIELEPVTEEDISEITSAYRRDAQLLSDLREFVN